jgi:hypothetical protein
MARRPYTTDARFFSDSSQIVRIKWFPVAFPVECLPFPSRINSLDWRSRKYEVTGVGEVFGADRPYNGAKPIPYAVGLEPCQPAAVFAQGEHFDPDLPPQLYDEMGMPLCCLNHVTMTGGLEWDGSAVVNVVSPGSTCATAIDGSYEYQPPISGVLAPGQTVWYKRHFFSSTSLAHWDVTLSGVVTASLNLQFWSDCSTPIWYASHGNLTLCYTFNYVNAVTVHYIKIENQNAVGDVSYTWYEEPGTCP